MPNFKIDGRHLEIRGASESVISVQFRWPIAQVLPAASVLIIRTEPSPGSGDNQNVFAVDLGGEVVWTVKPRTHVYEDSPYTNVEKRNEKVLLYNWDGLTVTFDPTALAEEAETYGR